MKIFIITVKIFHYFSCRRAGDALKRCLEDFSMPNGDLCGEDHLESSLEEHSDFLARHMKGFHYRNCQGVFKII